MTTLRKEYRIVLPVTLSEYNIAQLYTVAEMSKSESTGDTSIEILENIDFDHEIYGKCRKTIKTMNLNSKVPSVIRKVLPSKALSLEEVAYNLFPKCVTTYTNKAFSSSSFKVTVESLHIDGNIYKENIFNKSIGEWKETKVEYIDISKTIVDTKYDPTVFRSEKKGIGPLVIQSRDGKDKSKNKEYKDWIEECVDKNIPLMTCYKYVTVEINYFGFGWLTKEVDRNIQKIFIGAHQKLFCDMDNWCDLTLEDIRQIEVTTKEELKKIVSENVSSK
ncbi:phosphatidylinositol transfer protein [Hamiltosporidium tvaerminnensis]|uniref:Phosphatidylinositol transfer protein n=1 Tax=Hamiltosporidium tvaerminnensis TaxID=1176355 RepID=A0A4Q9KTE7_9MICR|nr:phosphatidylinositol transfer protein [Hamiltosporidium tvaerminnensis]